MPSCVASSFSQGEEEVIEEEEPGGDDQHCNGDETDGVAIGGHLSLTGVFAAQSALRKTTGPAPVCATGL